ncbi:hypothetical protein [Colwellia piezophila]|nr:hypothetical protein [Colwellia piezophila]
MKRPLRSNQRKKQLSRQHQKMTARRRSHFNQTINELFGLQTSEEHSQ